MKPLYRIACLLLLLSARPLAAQSVYTFASLGYDEQSARGLSALTSYYLRIPPTAGAQGGRLVLLLTPSQALLPTNSYVTVLVRSKPVVSLRVSQLPPTGEVSVPLSAASLEPNSEFLHVEVRTRLAISDDRCQDLENPALWLNVRADSYLVLPAAVNAAERLTLANCLLTKTAIVYPAKPSPTDLRVVSALYTRLKRLRPRGVALYSDQTAPDSLPNAVVVGERNTLAPKFKARLLRPVAEGMGLFALDTKPGSELLFVTGSGEAGYAKTVGAVSNPTLLASAFGRFMVVNQADDARTFSPKPDRLTLEYLGGVSEMMEGIGSLRAVRSFRISDFARQPDELEVHLDARYSGLQPGDRGFLNLYVNGILLSTTALDRLGYLTMSPRISRYLLKPYNELLVEFRFYPGQSVCKNSFLNFFAQVDAKRSYLRPTRTVSPTALSFYNFPGDFQTGRVDAVVSPDQLPHAVAGMAELVSQLNNPRSEYLAIPPVYRSDGYGLDTSKAHVLAFLGRQDGLWAKLNGVPVRFDRDFRLYNDTRSQPLFAVSDSVACAVAQVFRQDGRALMVLAANGPGPAEAFGSAARNVSDQLTNLASNVLVADRRNHYLFNLTEDQSLLSYGDEGNGLRNFWDRYNLYILAGLLVLVLLGFLYIRAKVKKSQAIFNTEPAS
jgi:hypothetical protein